MLTTSIEAAISNGYLIETGADEYSTHYAPSGCMLQYGTEPLLSVDYYSDSDSASYIFHTPRCSSIVDEYASPENDLEINVYL